MGMGMGRGSCTKFLVLALFLILFRARAETHVVGDSQGWGFAASYDSWSGGKNFAAGDTLVFSYQAGLHNVVPVNAAGYRSCRAPASSKVATTGNDKFTLKKGANYYICSIPGHCSAGMKIQVLAN